jgi:hypothetical protein
MKEQPIAYAGSFEPVAGKDRDAMALRDSSGKGERECCCCERRQGQ